MKNTDDSGKRISIIGNDIPRGMVWDDTRAFLAVARCGTLSAAAQDLNVGIATLSRRIERLESALKLPLFVRQQSGYELTEDGAELVEKAEAVEAAAHAFAVGADTQAQMSGQVRLATAENVATELILPELPAFRAQYPDLLVELVTDISTANLHRRDADLALRMVRPERGNVTLRGLGTLGYGLYCSTSYELRRDSNPDLGYYDTDDFITWGEMYSHLPTAQWIERVLRGRRPALTTTSLATQVAAAKAGLGLALLPHFIARDSGLVCVDADLGVDQPIYLVIQTDLAKSRRIRALADFLADVVARNSGRLGG